MVECLSSIQEDLGSICSRREQVLQRADATAWISVLQLGGGRLGGHRVGGAPRGSIAPVETFACSCDFSEKDQSQEGLADSDS